MKKGFILITGLLVLIFFGGCGNKDKNDFYDTYTFKEVTYLSPLSSATKDYLNESMAETKYIIKEDLFKIESGDDTFEISSPEYVKEDVKIDESPLFDDRILQENEIKYQYDIKNKDGSKTNWRLYASSNYLWIASYVDNTANGSEIIMSIFRLSK